MPFVFCGTGKEKKRIHVMPATRRKRGGNGGVESDAISAYEQQRLSNISQNAAVLESLGLAKVCRSVEAGFA
jgi:hypothetical protein